MTDVSTGEARKNLAALVNRVAYGKERVVMTRYGKQICALVPIEDLTLLDRLRSAADRNDIRDALSQHARGDAVDWSVLRRELELGS